MGLILKDQGREGPAQRHWKRALSFLKKSLQAENTQWGQTLMQELSSLLARERVLIIDNPRFAGHPDHLQKVFLPSL